MILKTVTKIIRKLFRLSGPNQAPQVPRYPVVLKELVFEDRERIRKWMQSPDTVFVLGLVEARRPSVFLSRTGANVQSPMDTLAASNRLHQIQGWDLFLLNLKLVSMEPSELKEPADDYNHETVE